MEEVPPYFKPSNAPLNYDVLALAYIIVALKLLFGFDDFRERYVLQNFRVSTRS